MARCTAPIYIHRTASGRENCPVCRGGYRNGCFYSTYSTLYFSSVNNSKRGSSNGGQIKTKARWSPAGSTILYSSAEIRTLTPVHENIEKCSKLADLREVSPLLGSRSGLSTIEESMEDIAAKIAELVTL